MSGIQMEHSVVLANRQRLGVSVLLSILVQKQGQRFLQNWTTCAPEFALPLCLSTPPIRQDVHGFRLASFGSAWANPSPRCTAGAQTVTAAASAGRNCAAADGVLAPAVCGRWAARIWMPLGVCSGCCAARPR
jgi:hypothetical protein